MMGAGWTLLPTGYVWETWLALMIANPVDHCGVSAVCAVYPSMVCIHAQAQLPCTHPCAFMPACWFAPDTAVNAHEPQALTTLLSAAGALRQLAGSLPCHAGDPACCSKERLCLAHIHAMFMPRPCVHVCRRCTTSTAWQHAMPRW
jgi:hypothetical protein